MTKILSLDKKKNKFFCFVLAKSYLCQINLAKILSLDKKKNKFFCFVLA